MKSYLAEFFAPPGEISPDPETAGVIIAANDLAEAIRAAEKVVEVEVTNPESFVTWISSPGEVGKPFAIGIHLINVEEVDLPYDVTAAEILNHE